jgi:hypothetical protein
MAGVKYRKLRIAWSVGWGLLCAMLMALWVRSYWRIDSLTYIQSVSKVICVVSSASQLEVLVTPQTIAHTGSGIRSYEITQPLVSNGPNGILGVYYHSSPGVITFIMPYWLLVTLCGTMSAIPTLILLRCRFTLRTLLIATTVVAVLLGLVVWAAK